MADLLSLDNATVMPPPSQSTLHSKRISCPDSVAMA